MLELGGRRDEPQSTSGTSLASAAAEAEADSGVLDSDWAAFGSGAGTAGGLGGVGRCTRAPWGAAVPWAATRDDATVGPRLPRGDRQRGWM